MNSFFTIIKSDFLQRTRSYAFLITLCASLAIAYTFVPEPNANYSTIRIADHIGFYNSVWFGYVTAIMTSIFLSLIGFYLVNSSIKTDMDSKVGLIIASTSILNFKYLLSKVVSNFLVLSTIVFIVFTMSIALFFMYHDGFAFEPFQFIKPYAIITLPAMFVIAVLAVVFEVFFRKYSIIQNIGFFFIFSALMVFSPKTESEFTLDIFGSKIVMHQLEERVREITGTDNNIDLSIGYVLGNTKKATQFEFNGVDFPTSFLISRLLWIIFGILIIFLISSVFHRFNLKEGIAFKKVSDLATKPKISNSVSLATLPKVMINYSIIPLLKTELLLLFRKGKKWLWFVNIGGMVLLAMLPLQMAHQMLLPLLWFLQVSRISDLTSKEAIHNVHYFAFTANKPMGRLLVSQLFSGILLMLFLATPLVIRLAVLSNFTAVIAILFGAIFIVLLATTFGILTQGKKLFEVLFFMITYANINGIVFVDYFGGFKHTSSYLIQLALYTFFLGVVSVLKRKSQLKG